MCDHQLPHDYQENDDDLLVLQLNLQQQVPQLDLQQQVPQLNFQQRSP